MIWVIIGFIAGAVFGIYDGYDPGDKFLGALVGGLIGIVAGATVMFGATVLGAAFGWNIQEVIESTEEHELVQISDTTYTNASGKVSGGVFVIRGTIGSKLAAGFSFYQKEEDGFALRTAEANDTTVKYTDKTPKIVTERKTCKVNEHPDMSVLWLNLCLVDNSTKHTIYVPEGSIMESYTLGGEE